MKTAIVYYSKHHGNTKKLLDAIAASHPVALIDVTEAPDADVSGYDRIGLASGIYFSSFAKQILAFEEAHLPEGKDVFFVATCGANPSDGFFRAAEKAAEAKNCRIVGKYICTGYDTFGPFKLVGGLRKGHPDASEIEGAVRFYEGLAEE